MKPNNLDFLVIGAQKCGTTWIHHVLSQHPDVFIPALKELHFFNKEENYRKGLSWFWAHFEGARDDQLLGECTPNYLWNYLPQDERPLPGQRYDTPESIARLFPEVKLICTLRDPVDRAVSAFHHHINQGRIRPSESILDHLNDLGIFSMGLYVKQIEAWLEHFDRSRLLVLIYEGQIRKDEAKPATARLLFGHLGLPSDDTISLFEQLNARRSNLAVRVSAGVPASSFAGRALRKAVEAVTPEFVDRKFAFDVKDSEKAELRALFAPHNRELEQLLGQKLPWR